MAKSVKRSTASSLSELLTKAERNLVESSVGRQLATATEKEVKAFVSRARALHDKWRDTVRRQARSTKATARAAMKTANARSREKLDLLATTLARFEARLAEFAGPSRPATTRAVKKKAAKKMAAASTTKRATKKTVKKAAKTGVKKAAKKKPATAAVAAADGEAGVVKPTGRRKKPAAPVTSARAKKARARQATAATPTQVINFDASQQRKARTAAKSARFKLEGLNTRRTRHAAASTRRNQARRDGR